MENISAKTVSELDDSKEIENMKKIEAALFLSARFLELKDLVLLTDVNPLMLKELVEKLIIRYNSDSSAIEIIKKGDMWKMDVGQEYVGMINKLATGSSEFTSAEQETLAVIAYKQPVKQSVIIKIRGNKSYDHIKKFIDIGLLSAKKIGHTKELKLSDDFYEYFHLQNRETNLNDPGESKDEPDLQNREANLNDLQDSENSEESRDLQNKENILNEPDELPIEPDLQNKKNDLNDSDNSNNLENNEPNEDTLEMNNPSSQEH